MHARPCTYADTNSTEILSVRNNGIFKGEKFAHDIREICEFKVQVREPSFGYYVDTVGKNTAAIKSYIQNQIKEDLEYDQMTLVEYIDPFTGEPVKKNKK